MISPLYRIAWQMTNGSKGQGQYCLTLEAGQSWIQYLKQEYPDMEHWLE